MPFTPFHLGPAILIGLLLRKYIDLPTFVAANLLVDIRATLVFFGVMEGSLHGVIHSYIFAAHLGILLAAVMYYLRNYTEEFMTLFKLNQLDTWKSFLLAGISGTWIHVTLDSFLYTDIQPFMPLEGNPLYGFYSSTPYIEVYGLCVVSLVLGVIYYGYIYYRS